MLPKEVQLELAKRYGGAKLVKEAFDQNLAKAFAAQFEGERQEHAAVVIVDIAGFSSFVSSWDAQRIRTFLDDYYRQVMPVLFELGGMIDRVAGDGILAVFSSFFTQEQANTMEKRAISAAERIVESVAGTNHSSKGVVSAGSLSFCKTGVAGIYEEYTVIGAPITTAYRLEEVAEVDQVIIEGSPGLSRIIDQQLEPSRSMVARGRPIVARWKVAPREIKLRGVGPTSVYVQTLDRQRP